VRSFAAAAILAVAALSAACSFFEELKSAESAEADTDSEADTEDVPVPEGACQFPIDDRCGDQDTVHRCDPSTNEFELWSCSDQCGQFTNFSCVATGTGQHGCWCTEPGLQKVLSCSELATCLEDCVGDPTGGCADQCFSRTDTATVRLFGALVYCAHSNCHETCINSPEVCGACIDGAVRAGQSGCAFPRSVCDGDRNDEPWSPYG
jgi:hypothetical protein